MLIRVGGCNIPYNTGGYALPNIQTMYVWCDGYAESLPEFSGSPLPDLTSRLQRNRMFLYRLLVDSILWETSVTQSLVN